MNTIFKGLSFALILLTSSFAETLYAQVDRFPSGGATRYSNGTYYFPMSSRFYASPGEVVTPGGEVINCQKAQGKCLQILAEAARVVMKDGANEVQVSETSAQGHKALELVSLYNAEFADLGENKSGIYFRAYGDEQWTYMKFFSASHSKVIKSAKRRKK